MKIVILAMLFAAPCVAEETNDYRVVNGTVYNLKLRKEWESTSDLVRASNRPLPGWELLTAKLLATNAQGIIVLLINSSHQDTPLPVIKNSALIREDERRVLQARSDAAVKNRIGSSWYYKAGGRLILLKNFSREAATAAAGQATPSPGQRDPTQIDIFKVYAFDIKSHTRMTVNGKSLEVDVWDHGIVPEIRKPAKQL